MSDEVDATIVAMPHAFVPPDGSFVELTFKDKDGRKLKLSFHPDRLERMAARGSYSRCSNS
jgi:hypothetical protein